MYLISKLENNHITYFVAEDIKSAQLIYEREKAPLVKSYGIESKYLCDHRTLDDGSIIETVSSFLDYDLDLRISLEKTQEDLDFYCRVHRQTKQSFNVIDERS